MEGSLNKKRILEWCEQMQYYPNAAGKALKQGDNNTILFVKKQIKSQQNIKNKTSVK